MPAARTGARNKHAPPRPGGQAAAANEPDELINRRSPSCRPRQPNAGLTGNSSTLICDAAARDPGDRDRRAQSRRRARRPARRVQVRVADRGGPRTAPRDPRSSGNALTGGVRSDHSPSRSISHRLPSVRAGLAARSRRQRSPPTAANSPIVPPSTFRRGAGAAATPESRPVRLRGAARTQWAGWVGGLALALGGIFLGRDLIEQGGRGPGVRMSWAPSAAAPTAGGERARRNERARRSPACRAPTSEHTHCGRHHRAYADADAADAPTILWRRARLRPARTGGLATSPPRCRTSGAGRARLIGADATPLWPPPPSPTIGR